MVICMTGGGLIRDVVTDIYYQLARAVGCGGGCAGGLFVAGSVC